MPDGSRSSEFPQYPRRDFLKLVPFFLAGAATTASSAERRIGSFFSECAAFINDANNLPNPAESLYTRQMIEYGDIQETVPIQPSLDDSRPVGVYVCGDSLGVGFTQLPFKKEKTKTQTPPTDLSALVNPSRLLPSFLAQEVPADIIPQYASISPTNIFCDEFNAGYMQGDRNSSLPDFRFFFNSYARIGATFEDIHHQLDTVITSAQIMSTTMPELPVDFVLAVGGNNAMNWLSEQLPADPSAILHNFKKQFLVDFQGQMEKLLERMVTIQRGGGQLGDMQHIFVTGIPNLGQEDNQIYLGGPNPPLYKLNMDLPFLRSTLTAACKYMNAAIIQAIYNVSQRHPDAPRMVFENIFDLPVNGIHPTEGGYRQIAQRRLERCRGNFPGIGMSNFASIAKPIDIQAEPVIFLSN